jgi:hypothetical protein
VLEKSILDVNIENTEESHHEEVKKSLDLTLDARIQDSTRSLAH